MLFPFKAHFVCALASAASTVKEVGVVPSLSILAVWQMVSKSSELLSTEYVGLLGFSHAVCCVGSLYFNENLTHLSFSFSHTQGRFPVPIDIGTGTASSHTRGTESYFPLTMY